MKAAFFPMADQLKFAVGMQLVASWTTMHSWSVSRPPFNVSTAGKVAAEA